MLTASDIREVALSLPYAQEAEHWGKPTFRVSNKIFVIIQNDERIITVKITREEREFYHSLDPNTYRIPESFPNMNYMHIYLPTARDDEVKDLIRNAWANVVPKKISKAYFEGKL